MIISHNFLEDLAFVLSVAAVVSVIFQALKQPVVVGYLVAGMMVGPYFPFPLFADMDRIHKLSELGVILLMFALGLEFSIRKLIELAPSCGFITVVQVAVMMWLGYEIGRGFGWSQLEGVFTGAILAISSTTIVAKAFAEEKVAKNLSELVFGVTLFEDLAAVIILAVLTAIATGSGLSPKLIAITVGKLVFFLAALIGGGALKPGELTLAHRGVLFLDELPEFPRNALEALREPLESGSVVVSRLRRSCEFPAQFQLVAAMNPCPCGYAGDPRGRCHCTAEQIARYRNRLSGPLIDRIDIHVELMALPLNHLMGDSPDASEMSEASSAVALRVAAARDLQLRRQEKLNSRLTPSEVARFCRLAADSRALLATAIARLGLSARAYHRVLRLARTCADLAAAPDIRIVDVAEAVNLRALDRPT